MTDYSKLSLLTTLNAFKNQNVYPGSIVLPISVPPATVSAPFTTASVSFTVSDSPVYTEFFAYFQELSDTIFANVNPQWYNGAVSGAPNIAYPTVKDPTYGVISFSLYPVINGTTVTVVAQGQNQTAHTFTANITVPFVFIEYTLAN